jgi:streptogramin lyase
LKRSLTTLIGLAAVTAVVAVPTVASAASPAPGSVASLTVGPAAFSGAFAPLSAGAHGITGTAYSPCATNGPWYESAVARTKSGTGSILLSFSQLDPDGLDWELLGEHNNEIGPENSWTGHETNYTQSFGTVSNGTIFYNDFKTYSGDCLQGNYSFTGTETY